MRRLSTKQNVDAPDSDFPYGRIGNNTGLNNGTPVNESLYGDIQQFFERMFDKSGLTANGLPDCAYTGFQLYQALTLASTPYKSYRVIVSQSGTGAPTITVLGGNAIGNVVWTRIGVGQYEATLTGAFTLNKTSFIYESYANNGLNSGFVKMYFSGSANVLSLSTYDDTFILADDLLVSTCIEIRVDR